MIGHLRIIVASPAEAVQQTAVAVTLVALNPVAQANPFPLATTGPPAAAGDS